jgi:hypothetical protein
MTLFAAAISGCEARVGQSSLEQRTPLIHLAIMLIELGEAGHARNEGGR